ncbi:ABC transporter substrate-binding protein [Micromonospora sp. NPDC005113]
MKSPASASRRALLLAVTALTAASLVACGDNSDTETAGSSGGLTKLTVLEPINSPIAHAYRVALAAGYYKAEGLDVKLEFLNGGGDVAQQLLGGNGDVGVMPLGNTAQALAQGHDDLRAIFNSTYGSLFSIAVNQDSPIQGPSDLKGKKIGVTALSDGAVPIVRGIIGEGGLGANDAAITAIGDGTALQVRALKNKTVDAFGGSINDMVALQAQGMNLRLISPKALENLPASGVVVKADYLAAHRKQLEGFVRATAKGAYWAQVEPNATLAVLKKETPEQFSSARGEAIFRATLPLTWNSAGPMGAQTADDWAKYFDFIGLKRPSTPLDQVVVPDLIAPANDFDKQAVANDAKNYKP